MSAYLRPDSYNWTRNLSPEMFFISSLEGRQHQTTLQRLGILYNWTYICAIFRAKTKNFVSVGWRPANVDKKACKRFFLDKSKDAAGFAPKGRVCAKFSKLFYK